jgi:hypothetical protein
MEKYFRGRQATDDSWCIRIACWIRKAKNVHTECVILAALPQQHLLHERASILSYTYIARLVTYNLAKFHT